MRYIVPVAAGGGSDMVARVVTEWWGKLLGQTFIVENQGGGGGVIACVATARAAPAGYTLMQGYVGTHGTTPATRRVPYNAVKDFTPIGMIGATPNVLVVGGTLPVKTLAALVEPVLGAAKVATIAAKSRALATLVDVRELVALCRP